MFTLYLKELAHMHYEVLQNCFLPHIFNSLLGESPDGPDWSDGTMNVRVCLLHTEQHKVLATL